MAISLVALGAFTSSTGAITPALPAGIAVNDLLLLFLETHQEAATIPTPNGGTWTAAPSSPQGSGSTGANSSARITVFYSFYNGVQGNPTTNDPGDHISGRIAAFRGVDLVSPFNTSSGGVNTNAGATATVNGATTTVPGCVVVGCGATEDDGDSIGPWTAGSGLASLTEMFENVHAAGDQGLITAWYAQKATTGAYGNSTATVTSGQQRAFMSLALTPDEKRRAQVSFAELELGDALRRARVSFAELELGDANRRGQISFAEMETTLGLREGQISFAEMELGAADRNAQISFAEMETTIGPREGQISFAEMELGNADRRGQISFADFMLPLENARTARISFAEFIVPNLPSPGGGGGNYPIYRRRRIGW